MGMNDRMYIEPELVELLEQVIDSEVLSPTAQRIAILVLNEGFAFLTDKQMKVFDRYVQSELRKASIANELRLNREAMEE